MTKKELLTILNGARDDILRQMQDQALDKAGSDYQLYDKLLAWRDKAVKEARIDELKQLYWVNLHGVDTTFNDGKPYKVSLGEDGEDDNEVRGTTQSPDNPNYWTKRTKHRNELKAELRQAFTEKYGERE